MPKDWDDPQVLRWEGGLIIQVDRLANVLAKLTKQLHRGRTASEIAGAYMDLRNIANHIEKLHGELSQVES
jgi:hypothetical protein